MNIVDIHAHVNDERLYGEADSVAAAAKAAGITAVVNAAWNTESAARGAQLASKYPMMYFTAGIHPSDSAAADDSAYAEIARLAENEKAVAVGEIGLDYHYGYPRDVQKRVFTEQLELADSLKLPVVIHLREAFGDMEKILEDNKSRIKHGALLHCYSGSAEMLEVFNRYDMYYSFGGIITFADKAAVLKKVPVDRLTLETDCPYLTPAPYRGKANRPEYIIHTLDKAAAILDTAPEKLAELTTKNALSLFKRLKINV